MTCVDLVFLATLFSHMRGRVRYGFGNKADEGKRTLDCDSHEIDTIDCSGWTRYAIHKATKGAVTLPDGSGQQHEWCEEHLRKLKQYSDVQFAAPDPSRLFIGFIEPKGSHPGHVWLVCGGKTMESHGGAGVDSRPWDTAVLKNNAVAAYEIPTC